MARIALHLLLAAFLVIPAIAAPAWAAADAMQATATAAMADSPCDAMAPRPPCSLRAIAACRMAATFLFVWEQAACRICRA